MVDKVWVEDRGHETDIGEDVTEEREWMRRFQEKHKFLCMRTDYRED